MCAWRVVGAWRVVVLGTFGQIARIEVCLVCLVWLVRLFCVVCLVRLVCLVCLAGLQRHYHSVVGLARQVKTLVVSFCDLAAVGLDARHVVVVVALVGTNVDANTVVCLAHIVKVLPCTTDWRVVL